MRRKRRTREPLINENKIKYQRNYKEKSIYFNISVINRTPFVLTIVEHTA